MGPNILLIVFDTARADAFEPYGAPAGASPVVADLARRGGAAERVHAASCWTMPSHAAMFTGLLPRAAGMTRAPGGDAFALPPLLERHRERLLASVFARAGYATAGVSANLWISSRTGFATGFDRFVDVDSHLAAEAAMSRGGRGRWALSAIRAREDNGATAAAEAIEGWLGELGSGDQGRREKPFFWFVNLIEAHSPYLPPKPFTDLSAIERVRAAGEARRWLTLDETWKACAGGFEVPAGALERMRRGYRGSIRLLDDWLGRVLEGLDGAGVLDETLVIATSDHGENFGEDGLMQHAFSLDERLLRVPLVSAGPGSDALGAKPRLSLAALPALLAGLAGIDDHPWREVEPGAVPVAEFDPPAPFVEPELVAKALASWGLALEQAPRISTELTAAIDGDAKLLRRGGKELLFDLGSDPLERSPVDPAQADSERLARLRAALPAAADAAPGPPVTAGNDEIDQAERAALEERMRILGYM